MNSQWLFMMRMLYKYLSLDSVSFSCQARQKIPPRQKKHVLIIPKMHILTFQKKKSFQLHQKNSFSLLKSLFISLHTSFNRQKYFIYPNFNTFFSFFFSCRLLNFFFYFSALPFSLICLCPSLRFLSRYLFIFRVFALYRHVFFSLADFRL